MSLNRCLFWYEAGAERIDFTFYGGFPIDYPSGVDGLGATISTNRSLDGVGTEIQLAQVPERPINITGYIITPDTREQERKLHRMFAPLKKGKLYAETMEHEVFYLDCISASEPTVQGKRRFPHFLVQLSAGYPYWQAVEEREITLTLTGTRTTAAVRVESDVDAVHRAVLRCTGSCENIAILDDASKMELRYSGSLRPGEVLEITISPFGKVSALINGESVIGLVDCSLKKLPTGSRNLTITAESNSGSITAEIFYKEGRAGV